MHIHVHPKCRVTLSISRVRVVPSRFAQEIARRRRSEAEFVESAGFLERHPTSGWTKSSWAPPKNPWNDESPANGNDVSRSFKKVVRNGFRS